MAFAALNPFYDLRQTQFRGKKRSVSDLVTCDPYKPHERGACAFALRIGLDAVIGHRPDSFAIGRRSPRSDHGVVPN